MAFSWKISVYSSPSYSRFKWSFILGTVMLLSSDITILTIIVTFKTWNYCNLYTILWILF